MPAQLGRPSLYSEELADEICLRMIQGESLNQICKSDEMPEKATIFNWLAQKRGLFLDKYQRARELQAERMLEEIFEIADDTSRDTIFQKRGDEEVEVINSEWVNRSKLRVDTRKWAMARMNPRKYGDKIQQEITGQIDVKAIVVPALEQPGKQRALPAFDVIEGE